jgi:putative ABC transport system ATP-binding protein
MSIPALEARSLYRFFHAGDDEVFALRDVSFSAERGEIVAVMGPSGSGKSTLLACLAGLDEPDGGQVLVDGERLTRRPESARARMRARSIGMLFQSNNLVPHLTVAENLSVVRRLAARSAPPTDPLEQLGLLAHRDALVSQLSGGEAARAGLAVSIANDPTVLLADEPTGELDGVTEDRVVALLRDQANRGSAVVVVTHSPSVSAMADRILTLHDGGVVA